MIQRLFTIALVGVTLASLSSCNKDGYKKFKGLEYKIVKEGSGKRKAQIGDVIELNVRFLVGDSLIQDSRSMNGGKPFKQAVNEGAYRGDFFGAFTLLKAGDSAVFRILFDSLKKNIPQQPQFPPFMKPGKYITYEVSVVSIMNKEEVQAEQQKQMQEMQQKAEASKITDDKTLQDYFAKNNIKATKTASGLYYTLKSEGTGAPVKQGDTVSVKYIGRTLNGKVFDANMGPDAKHTELLKFAAGTPGMIAGFSEGIMLLKKGGKATIYMPSALGYGPQAMGNDIPAFSILTFDIELADIKK